MSRDDWRTEPAFREGCDCVRCMANRPEQPNIGNGDGTHKGVGLLLVVLSGLVVGAAVVGALMAFGVLP